MRRGFTILAGGVVLALAAGCATDEGPPSGDSDLLLAELWLEQGLVDLKPPSNITKRDGYDNQPFFTPDSQGILYVQRAPDRNTDVFRYDVASEETVQLTDTPEREYSPQPLPDGSGFSVVRIDTAGQRGLWSYDWAGSNPQPLIEDDNVFYYAWVDEARVAASFGESPPELYLVDVDTGQRQLIATGIGRSVQQVPGRQAVSYVRKETPADWWIEVFDLATGEPWQVARTLQGREDHCWSPNGTVLMVTDGVLYGLSPEAGAGWEEVGDLSGDEDGRLSRLAVSPEGTKIVAVVDR